MGFFDQLTKSLTNQATHAANSAVNSAVNKTVNNAVNSAVNSATNAVSGSGKKQTKSFTFSALPRSLSDLQALPESSLTDEFAVAALTVLSLIEYGENVDAAYEMLNFLKGPEPLSAYEKQFLRDRFSYQNYVAKSYIKGATPDNNYEGSQPYVIEVSENPYSRSDDTHITLWLKSGGADSPREVKLRKKPSTGQWFLVEQMLLGGIRESKASDPWA